MNSNNEVFVSLVRLGIGAVCDTASAPGNIDWPAIQVLAKQQGLSAVVLDGVDILRKNDSSVDLPDKKLLTQWIGELLHYESIYMLQQKAAAEMALLFNSNDIRTYVLKGTIVAECYPRPKHRLSVDLDCYLLPKEDRFDAWDLGNNLIKARKYEVKYDFYKNSTFSLPGLTVENHKFFTPFRGNKQLMALERVLQSLISADKGKDKFEGTWLYRPPVMVSALFLIEHAYSHFLHEGLTWRLVLDWMMFSKKHKDEIDWQVLNAHIDEFGFRMFYDSFCRLGQYLLGELSMENLENRDKLMLEDVWADLDLHETVRGIKGKFALFGNTWRAKWKYKYFSEISMPHALWIQVKGFLFNKNPKLG